MIQLIRSADRYHAQTDWLDTRWHFSFDDYYDPANMNWGPLRVFNDDIVQPAGGFPMHPHRDMEIITYVVEGELEHKDHLGHVGRVRAGEVQVMSAGKGIMHSEYNPSKTAPVHLMQLWVMPRTKSLPPRYEQRQFTPEQRNGKLLAVVTPTHAAMDSSLHIDQDATIYVGRLQTGQNVAHHTASGRKLYLFLISGALDLNGQAMNAGDQARIDNETELTLRAESDSELILLDMLDKQ